VKNPALRKAHFVILSEESRVLRAGHTWTSVAMEKLWLGGRGGGKPQIVVRFLPKTVWQL
jgi:hypothetical protein